MIEILPWVERLGGWVVVVAIVFAGIRRLDMMARERNEHFHRLVAAMQESLQIHAQAQRSFEAFEREEHTVHEELINEARQTNTALAAIARSLEKQSALLDAILTRLNALERGEA